MGKPTGFLEIARKERGYAHVAQRITHYNEFIVPLEEDDLKNQGARCMDCGIPFCHNGCPVSNVIPDFNDLVYRGRWRQALEVLHATNNFPEVTGRICPAPCEAACTLNLTDQPVTIRTLECAIIDRGWAEGWIVPQIPTHRTGRRVAVVGSGPAGLACAQQLARAGHFVVVFEKNPRIGGLLRYGIPDFKLDKRLLDRRIAQMRAEGVEFRTNSPVGAGLPVQHLLARYDAIVLAGGSEQPRDMSAEGRTLDGVHFAMDFLSQQNRIVSDQPVTARRITAQHKHVVVIGGGDTGSDCIGTAVRQSAASVTQIEIMPRPPEKENKEKTWPDWPGKVRTSTSHEEGCRREWGVTTKAFLGENGMVQALACARVHWEGGTATPIPGSDFVLPADLVLLAMGFVHPVHTGLLADLGVAFDARRNVRADTLTYQTSIPKVFAAGDMRRGQSLVVWALREGRQCAHAVDAFLVGRSLLPR
ncbi:MAG: glutamate synthase (NADPH/NADH) small chain [Rhodospirillaceae bacterium]|nr:MAG: glutamate synthase (NADPH/NADH) small chain [Rhodospirillaceae bacterium]